MPERRGEKLRQQGDGTVAQFESKSQESPEALRLKVFLFSVLVVIVFPCVMIWSCVRAVDRAAQTTPAEDAQFDAYAMAQTFVDERLVSPSSADYPTMRDPTVKVQEVEGQWYVAGYVDSDNALGASIRTRYNVVMQQLPNSKWRLVDIEIE